MLTQADVARKAKVALILRARPARFDPDARDGDNDGMVQDGTPFRRPARPRKAAAPAKAAKKAAPAKNAAPTIKVEGVPIAEFTADEVAGFARNGLLSRAVAAKELRRRADLAEAEVGPSTAARLRSLADELEVKPAKKAAPAKAAASGPSKRERDLLASAAADRKEIARLEALTDEGQRHFAQGRIDRLRLDARRAEEEAQRLADARARRARPPLDLADVAARVREAKGIDAAYAVLDEDERLTPAKLRRLAREELGMSVPAAAQTRGAILLWLATAVKRPDLVAPAKTAAPAKASPAKAVAKKAPAKRAPKPPPDMLDDHEVLMKVGAMQDRPDVAVSAREVKALQQSGHLTDWVAGRVELTPKGRRYFDAYSEPGAFPARLPDGLSPTLAGRWPELSDAERRRYIEAAARDMDRHLVEQRELNDARRAERASWSEYDPRREMYARDIASAEREIENVERKADALRGLLRDAGDAGTERPAELTPAPDEAEVAARRQRFIARTDAWLKELQERYGRSDPAVAETVERLRHNGWRFVGANATGNVFEVESPDGARTMFVHVGSAASNGTVEFSGPPTGASLRDYVGRIPSDRARSVAELRGLSRDEVEAQLRRLFRAELEAMATELGVPTAQSRPRMQQAVADAIVSPKPAPPRPAAPVATDWKPPDVPRTRQRAVLTPVDNPDGVFAQWERDIAELAAERSKIAGDHDGAMHAANVAATRNLLERLRSAGWAPVRDGEGRLWWRSPNGRRTFAVPTAVVGEKFANDLIRQYVDAPPTNSRRLRQPSLPGMGRPRGTLAPRAPSEPTMLSNADIPAWQPGSLVTYEGRRYYVWSLGPGGTVWLVPEERRPGDPAALNVHPPGTASGGRRGVRRADLEAKLQDYISRHAGRTAERTASSIARSLAQPESHVLWAAIQYVNRAAA